MTARPDPRTFGTAPAWQLRAKLERRRSARRCGVAALAFAVMAGAGAALCCSYSQPGAAAVLGIAAFGALLVTAAAASEA